MPAVIPATPTLTVVADYAVFVLRFPLIFIIAALFSLSFGVYMIDAMGAWPRPRREAESEVKGNGFASHGIAYSDDRHPAATRVRSEFA
ncbi:hypothetical protein BZA05DRAFT_470550 [Tricharina praecox]|uniref:uncharacterized protein n=1 Tax=Tricharina praecox TaxID=43433 RepID=UPI00221FDA82|nr:uncharacterized protein BZA05DRAFT_470550 [Tricharina praecox]KAI5857674.1 hypothetical protein BZA05DRAFT_470550 [Tricharina praecox]